MPENYQLAFSVAFHFNIFKPTFLCSELVTNLHEDIKQMKLYFKLELERQNESSLDKNSALNIVVAYDRSKMLHFVLLFQVDMYRQ